ncbi:MAG: cation:proton antiporter, partial [Candidatus Aenigmatarchaeota archaeon]
SPLSVLLPLMFLGIVTNPSIFEPIKHISQFWLLIAAGVGTGLVVGFGMTKILKTILKEYTPLLLFATALITFTLAENVGGSGMLAVAICGLIVGNYSSGIREEALKFEDQISELLRIAVFTLLGAQIYFSITAEQFLLALVFFFVIVILRPLMLILFMRKERKEMSREDFLMLSFIAPKGAVEAAMAPVVASALLIAGMSAMADSIMNIVFCIIVFSILLSTIICEIAYKKSEKEKSIKKIYKNYEKLRLPKS